MSFKILFMGTPEFSVPVLKSIHGTNNKILEVYTQPPKKKNRGQKILNSPIHEFSKKLGIPIRNPLAFDEKEINHIKNLKPLVEFITNLKYKYYTVVYDEDNETYTLVKKTHTVSSIERVIDEEPKIIKYKL